MKSSDSYIRRPKLILEVAVVLTCKLLFIFGLWYFFFSPEHRPAVSPDTVSQALLGTQEKASQDPSSTVHQ